MRLTILAAAASLMMIASDQLHSATLAPLPRWSLTEPATYECNTEKSAGYGPKQGLHFEHFEITITPLSKMPDSDRLRERWPDKTATYGQSDVYFLEVGRNRPETALLGDSYFGRAPEPTLFTSGPPDPMEDAIKFSGYANTFIFHLDDKHAFALFVYGAPYYEWVVDGHCVRKE